MPTVLYVVNEARRTGAPQSAVEILRVLGQLGWQRHVLLLAPGPLESELRQVSETLSTDQSITSLLRRLRWHHRRVGLRYEFRQAATHIRTETPDAIIGDTVVSLPFVLEGLRAGIPTGLLVRDRPAVIDTFLGVYDPALAIERAVLAANSVATRDEVAARTTLPQADVLVVPPVVDVKRVSDDATRARAERAPHDTLRVVALGTIGPRKGTDLFLEVARHVLAVRRDVEFLWLGDGRTRRRFQQIAHRAGMTDNVHFPGSTSDPALCLGRADAVLIPSREEPLSRVAVEALAAGLPVVAFDVGGIPEALGTAGNLVPALAVEAMADSLLHVLEEAPSDPAVEQARQDQARLHDVSVLPARVQALVHRLVGVMP